ncbi:hypothetical protein N9Y42_10585 [Mariniblastus sp.]|nr:hypothetical protein [Mariniblastus sp.]
MDELTKERFLLNVKSKRFITAYELLLDTLEKSPQDADAISLSRLLSKEVRRRAMDLSMKKATECSNEAQEMCALLKLVIRLNGETEYG